MSRKPILAVVGRPNVGKSTLFNRLIRQRRAIVDDQPGVTRDRHYAPCEWGGREFMIMDTGGYVPDGRDLFNTAIREQVQLALEEADAILLLGDAVTGITDTDLMMAHLIRSTGKPYILAVNKADNAARELDVAEFWNLGLNEPYPVAAVNGRNTGELLDHIVEMMPLKGRCDIEGDLRVAIIGRPNVGKSSLVNKLIGTEKLMVTAIPGTTRDAIDSVVKHEGHRFVLIDTAGLRRRTKIKENVEFYSGLRSKRAIDDSDVCILLLDSDEGLTHQDIQVLEEAIRARKGVLIAINKWDLITDKETNTARDYERELKESIPTLAWVEVVFISALTGQRTRRVLDLALEIHKRKQVHLKRVQLEEYLLAETEKRPHPTRKGKWIRFEAVRQVKTDPPWIVFQCTHPDIVDFSYGRFLENRLRSRFDLRGIPVRLEFRSKQEFTQGFGSEMEPGLADFKAEQEALLEQSEMESNETHPEEHKPPVAVDEPFSDDAPLMTDDDDFPAEDLIVDVEHTDQDETATED
jgi:GTPase